MAMLKNLGKTFEQISGRFTNSSTYNVGKKVASSVGRAGSASGKAVMAGKGNKTIIAGAAALGLASGQFENLNNAAMDIAFGDPNADQYFLGGEGLSPTRLLTAGVITSPTQMASISAASGAVGAGVGAFSGAQALGIIGGRRAGGKALGAIGGGLIGAAVGAVAPTAAVVGNNREFYASSAYSRGSAMQASSTGAYGDIVLGMHNMRRG